MSHISEKEMLAKLIECVENTEAARIKYAQHPGGGASQKIKNKLAKEYSQKLSQLNNAVFNIKQQLK